jgi:cupin 2 domain-containing protein
MPSRQKEIFETIFKDNFIKIERIISYGQSSPVDFWYDQNENEFVILLDGFAKIEFENDTITLKRGDYLLIPSHTKHRVAFTDTDKPTIWLAIFFKGDKNG